MSQSSGEYKKKLKPMLNKRNVCIPEGLTLPI